MTALLLLTPAGQASVLAADGQHILSGPEPAASAVDDGSSCYDFAFDPDGNEQGEEILNTGEEGVSVSSGGEVHLKTCKPGPCMPVWPAPPEAHPECAVDLVCELIRDLVPAGKVLTCTETAPPGRVQINDAVDGRVAIVAASDAAGPGVRTFA